MTVTARGRRRSTWSWGLLIELTFAQPFEVQRFVADDGPTKQVRVMARGNLRRFPDAETLLPRLDT